MVYPDLNFEKNFDFTEGTIILLKNGYYQVMGPTLAVKDGLAMLKIATPNEAKQPGDTFRIADLIHISRLELISQLLDIPQTELLEILYA